MVLIILRGLNGQNNEKRRKIAVW